MRGQDASAIESIRNRSQRVNTQAGDFYFGTKRLNDLMSYSRLVGLVALITILILGVSIFVVPVAIRDSAIAIIVALALFVIAARLAIDFLKWRVTLRRKIMDEQEAKQQRQKAEQRQIAREKAIPAWTGASVPLIKPQTKSPDWTKPQLRQLKDDSDIMDYVRNAVAWTCREHGWLMCVDRLGPERTFLKVDCAHFDNDNPAPGAKAFLGVVVSFRKEAPDSPDIQVWSSSGSNDASVFAESVKWNIAQAVKEWREKQGELGVQSTHTQTKAMAEDATPTEQGQPTQEGESANKSGYEASHIVGPTPRLPQKPFMKRRWKETWKYVRAGTIKVKPYKEICEWLERMHPDLRCSPETLSDIIRAGEKGLLED